MKKNIAPLFIMIASGLWAIDALFRTQLTYKIPAASIIFFEHVIGFIILSPIFVKAIPHIKKLTRQDWINFIILTILSSTLGGLLFTAALAKSFALNDFVTPILLQKLQPVFVIGLSALLLKERLTPKFIILAIFSFIGSYLISFGTTAVNFSLSGKELVVLLSLGATLSWGAGTIFSKKILGKLDFPEATALRFLLAIPVTLIFAFALNQTYNFTQLSFDQLWRFIVIAGVTGGVFSLLMYYRGLKYTEAKVSTIAELMYPIVGILIAITPLNPYGQPQTIQMTQVIGIVILLTSIVLISFDRAEKK